MNMNLIKSSFFLFFTNLVVSTKYTHFPKPNKIVYSPVPSVSVMSRCEVFQTNSMIVFRGGLYSVGTELSLFFGMRASSFIMYPVFWKEPPPPQKLLQRRGRFVIAGWNYPTTVTTLTGMEVNKHGQGLFSERNRGRRITRPVFLA